MKLRTITSLVVLLVLVGTAPVRAQQVRPRQHRSVAHVALYALGGAIVGAWTGYVASQVARSDWNDGSGLSSERIRFSLSGGALGLLVGAWLGGRGGSETPAPLPAPTRPGGLTGGGPGAHGAAHAAGGRNAPITEAEIRASSAQTVTDLLRQVRPLWLRGRGTDVLRPSGDSGTPRGVRVYLNGSLLGGLEALDQVSIAAVTGIRFLDGPAAVLRWGAGDEDGAIELTTRTTP